MLLAIVVLGFTISFKALGVADKAAQHAKAEAARPGEQFTGMETDNGEQQNEEQAVSELSTPDAQEVEALLDGTHHALLQKLDRLIPLENKASAQL